LGYPELEIQGLAGIFGSKIMSEAVRNRIAADVAAICRDTDIRRKLEVSGHNVLSGTTEELKAGIETQRAAMSELAKSIDIRNPQ
jgi:tripartite-type tricarboxylate transporter receptor subunit TctC